MRYCSIEGCNRVHMARGFCSHHYHINITKNTKIPKKIPHGKTGTPEFRSWSAMRSRCLNKNDPGYKYYGGKGITIYPQWIGLNGFLYFLSYMGERPKEGKWSLDRIDPSKNYKPGNVRWANTKTQRVNQGMRTNNTSGFMGVTRSASKIIRWAAHIHSNNIDYHLGVYDDPREAAIAYNAAAIVLHGPDARLNVLDN